MPLLQLQDHINMVLLKIVYFKEKTTRGTKFWLKDKANIVLRRKKNLELKNKWFCHIQRNQ